MYCNYSVTKDGINRVYSKYFKFRITTRRTLNRVLWISGHFHCFFKSVCLNFKIGSFAPFQNAKIKRKKAKEKIMDEVFSTSYVGGCKTYTRYSV